MSRFHHARRLGAIPAVQEAPALPRNSVLLGDCIQVMAGLPAESVDFVLTDPPYVCRYRSREGLTVANDDRTDWLAPAFAEVYRLLKDDSLCVSFYGWQHADAFLSAWRRAGFRPVAHLVFPKRYGSSVGAFEARHEQAYVLTKGRRPRIASPIPDVLPWAYTGNRLHPTQKPLEALKPIIQALTSPQDLILDPFCGSGSTLLAARQLGRDYLGIELEPGHAETARLRLGG